MTAAALRIGLLTHSVNPRGGVVHTLELARALHEAGHRVTVFAPASAGQRLFRPVPFDVELIVVAPASPDTAAMVEARIAAFEQHLSARLHDVEFDVLHAQDPIGANALANLQDRRLIPRFVRTVHHLDRFDDERLVAWQRRGFERAAQVFCVSRLWCDRLRADYGIAAALVANGVDLSRFARAGAVSDQRLGSADAAQLAALGLRAGAKGGEPVFLAVGGVEERKNTLRTLQAFLMVRQRWPRAQLVVAGGASLLDHDRYAWAFEDAVAAAGLRTGPGAPLLMTGPLADSSIPALMRRADALLMPSLCEGFGLVVLEALACGTPVVVSKIAPFTEYLGDGDCCWADPGDCRSIAAAMAHALEPEQKARLARQVPDVCLRFNWRDSAARHVALYRAATRRTESMKATDARHAFSPSLAGCQ